MINSKGADQTVQMGRLVCAFVVIKPSKTVFLTSKSNLYKSLMTKLNTEMKYATQNSFIIGHIKNQLHFWFCI